MLFRLIGILIISCLFSSTVWAVGLGNIKVMSSLNQPLNAQINILDLKPSSLQQVKLLLPTEKEYQKLGVDPLAMIKNLNLIPTYDAYHQPVVKITSDQPIRQSIVNLVIKLETSNEIVFRQYTFFLNDKDSHVMPNASAMTSNSASNDHSTNKANSSGPSKTHDKNEVEINNQSAPVIKEPPLSIAKVTSLSQPPKEAKNNLPAGSSLNDVNNDKILKLKAKLAVTIKTLTLTREENNTLKIKLNALKQQNYQLLQKIISQDEEILGLEKQIARDLGKKSEQASQFILLPFSSFVLEDAFSSLLRKIGLFPQLYGKVGVAIVTLIILLLVVFYIKKRFTKKAKQAIKTKKSNPHPSLACSKNNEQNVSEVNSQESPSTLASKDNPIKQNCVEQGLNQKAGEEADLVEQEIATKLDLARVYVEMGEFPEAKVLIQEALIKGNTEQKKEANELLQRLESLE